MNEVPLIRDLLRKRLAPTFFACLYSMFKAYGFSFVKLKNHYEGDFNSLKNNGINFLTIYFLEDFAFFKW
jgi:hypothetical protein